ncbi:zinc finger CCHC domain-containing protein 17 [Octopus bimaculoides]|uniref:Zinc finger CCHC domain-containing protein 17 n=1 Tax=Octopus bimaculoides TaxID=37653 RepID=A0A0L8HEM4_OCTBM|nr:zinc finger CCHC domain-containing protein 17 [Octopus bimaculoides]|eukprot:XP_014772935.1 PREDICTED: nucleolar protein of 40 kDa-like [Octopus bimaculoides]
MSKRRSFDRDSAEASSSKRYRRDDEEPPKINTIFRGEVASVTNYGVFIQLPGYRKQGLVHKSQMSNSHVDDPSEVLSVRERVYCKVIAITDEGKISLSMKCVDQTSGKDMDPNNIQVSIDQRKQKKGFKREIQKIELGAVYDTTCKKCGAYGHFSKDCFSVNGKSYSLVPETDEGKHVSEKSHLSHEEKKLRKKEKKAKKAHKKKKKKHKKESKSSSDKHKKSKHKKKKKHHHHKSSSGSSNDSSSSSSYSP